MAFVVKHIFAWYM